MTTNGPETATSGENRAPTRPYHHGNLRTALLDAAVTLVRENGPDALTLREVSRRVGVSANAAYHHFAGLPDLQRAVVGVGLATLARSMQDELAACPAVLPTGTPAAGRVAAQRLRAVGRGYLRYSLRDPGLFAISFQPAGRTSGGYYEPFRTAPTAPPVATPASLLLDALRGLVAVGSMPPDGLLPATTTVWAGVHGLAVLLQGPLATTDTAARDAAIEATLDHLVAGVTDPPRPV